MARISVALLLLVCGTSLAQGQSASGPYLEQKQFTSRSKALSSAVFLGDGKTLATSSLVPDTKDPIQLWNVVTGECTGSLQGQVGGVFCLAVSRDGRYLASGGDGPVVVYDVSSGKESARIALAPGRVLALAFAPSGSILCAAGEDRRIHFLDLAAGKALDSLIAHDEAITSLAFAPDGKILYSGSFDGAVKIWEVAGRRLKEKLVANGGRIHGVAVSADGKKLAAACAGNPEGEMRLPEIALWNLEKSQKRQSLHDGAAEFTAVKFSGTDSVLAAARADGWVVAWSAEGLLCSRLKAHQTRITSLVFAPEGKSLVTTSWEPDARLWNLPLYAMAVALPGEIKNPSTLVYDRHANLLIAGGMDKTIRVLDPTGKKPERQLQLKAENTLGLAISADGKFLATTGGRENGPAQGPMRIVRFGVGGPPAVAKHESVTLWELETGKELRTLAGHQDLINVLAFSPNSQLLASGSADKTVRLWNVASGAELMQLIGHTGSIVGLAFHPNGRTLASASDDGVVRLWDLSTGHEKRSFQAHSGGLNGLAYSPDGRWLATCSSRGASGSMALWDAETTENAWLLPYSGTYLSGLTFGSNSRFMMAIGGFRSEAGVVRIVDVERGRPRIDLLSGKTQLAAACLSADGKTLFLAGQTADKGELLQRPLPTIDGP